MYFIRMNFVVYELSLNKTIKMEYLKDLFGICHALPYLKKIHEKNIGKFHHPINPQCQKKNHYRKYKPPQRLISLMNKSFSESARKRSKFTQDR
jgi:hypothetical protein